MGNSLPAFAAIRSLARRWHGALRKGKPMPTTRPLRSIPVQPARDRRRPVNRSGCLAFDLIVRTGCRAVRRHQPEKLQRDARPG